MTPDEMRMVRPRLEAFAAELLAELPRRDQRATGEVYLRGLMLDGQRKSMQPMAARLGVDHQRLQQFITSSTWDDGAVRRRLAGWAQATIAPDAFVIDDVGFPKDGLDSPGVARMYSGALGKTGNCQIGVSVHLVTDRASAAVDWRLFIPESWDDTLLDDPAKAEAVRRRRARCKLDDHVRHREKWRLALDMLDELTGAWGLPDRPVAADAGYGDITAFRLGLADRDLRYVVAVKPTTSAHPGAATPTRPPYGGRGRPPSVRYLDAPSNLRDLALAAGRSTLKTVTWRHGTRATKGNPTAKLRARFLAIRVRPANRDIPRAADGSLPACWLLAEWPPHEPEPTNYWLSNLDEATPLRVLVRLAKIRWRIEHDYRELKHGLGLDHFEGRSYAGWHRHVTLAAVAQAFCTQLRLDPKAPAPA
jgi:SRSO17 transposase